MKKVIAVALLSTVFAAPAFAEKFYAGGQLSSNSASGGYDAMGFGAFIGFPIQKNWAVEGSYNSFGTKDYGAGNSLAVSAMAVHGVYSHKIDNKLDLIGKIGFASTTGKWESTNTFCGFFGCQTFSASGSSSKSGLAYGVGGSYAMDSKLSIRGGYDIYAIEGSNLNSLYVGAAYKF